jgi:NAD(P)-dependent dehydrogenase (short-subunit alcohol dehydrogenase family)
MAVRNPKKCQEIVEESIERPLWKDRIFFEHCDVSDMSSVKDFAKKVQGKFQSINLLVNNGEQTLNNR